MGRLKNILYLWQATSPLQNGGCFLLAFRLVNIGSSASLPWSDWPVAKLWALIRSMSEVPPFCLDLIGKCVLFLLLMSKGHSKPQIIAGFRNLSLFVVVLVVNLTV